jgi:hypothetical protein
MISSRTCYPLLTRPAPGSKATDRRPGPFGKLGQGHVQVFTEFADVASDLLGDLRRRYRNGAHTSLTLSCHAFHLFLTGGYWTGNWAGHAPA